MSFHLTAQDIRVDDNHILRARLEQADGDWCDAEIDLDNHLGNNEGEFQWGGVNFSHSVEKVEFHIEGDDEVPVLRCFCRDSEGNEFARDVNLSERVENQNGRLVFI